MDYLKWNLKEIKNGALEHDDEKLEINLVLNAGDSREKKVEFKTISSVEGFGEIIFNFHYSGTNLSGNDCEWKTWISVFAKATANNKEYLDDDLRKRLVDVVNARTRNGHIFMADHVQFFSEFLNIIVPDEIAEILSGEMELDAEGLPVDEELYYRIVTGKMTFYGMEKMELLYEEDCNESDDRFDADGVREVLNPDID